MGFDDVIIALKEGHKARRSGWNGKNQYIQMVSHISFMLPDGTIANADHKTMGEKAILFHGSIGDQVGWLASQSDMLSEDWEIFD